MNDLAFRVDTWTPDGESIVETWPASRTTCHALDLTADAPGRRRAADKQSDPQRGAIQRS
jgi:hypothetical protein